MTRHPFIALSAACTASLLAHGIAYASLAFAPPPKVEPAPSRVTFRVHEAEAPRPLPPKPPEPEQPAPKPRAETSRPKPSPTLNAPVPPPVAAPVDLRGVTLTNDSGGGAWASAVGNGSSLNGPVGPIGAKLVPKPSAQPAPAPAASTVPVVDVADLSSRPVPPELTSNLREHYPAAARTRGIGGSATVRARIEPDGRVRRVELVAETFEGFGEACRRTLQGSSWSAPKDREGRAVATLVRYTCRFVVGP